MGSTNISSLPGAHTATLKRCSKCKEWKNRTDFSKDKSRRDHTASQCKQCRSQAWRIWYKNNKQYQDQRVAQWIRDHPEVSRLYSRQYYQKNKKRRLLQIEHHRQNNAKKYKEYNKISRNRYYFYRSIIALHYAVGNKPRKADRIIESTVQCVTKLYKNHPWCQACDIAIAPGNMHLDHIKPRKRYPELALEPANLQWLCKSCNLRKGSRDMQEWLTMEEQQARIVLPRLRKIVGGN